MANRLACKRLWIVHYTGDDELFTKIGYWLAALLLFIAGSRVVVAFVAAYTQNDQLVRRYLGSMTTAEAIESGFKVMAASIALGILCEISQAVRR